MLSPDILDCFGSPMIFYPQFRDSKRVTRYINIGFFARCLLLSHSPSPGGYGLAMRLDLRFALPWSHI